MKRSHGMPAWDDFATEPCTSKWNTTSLCQMRSSVQPPPSRTPRTRSSIPHNSVPDEINVGVILVRRPVALEIVEESIPIGLEAMLFEIAHREREAVIDADQRTVYLPSAV